MRETTNVRLKNIKGKNGAVGRNLRKNTKSPRIEQILRVNGGIKREVEGVEAKHKLMDNNCG